MPSMPKQSAKLNKKQSFKPAFVCNSFESTIESCNYELDNNQINNKKSNKIIDF